ncbi:MAG: NAD(P)-binding domain-containing protein [Ignavibacteriaceae bacterium]|jgi:thioredoxin reductase/Pyruvate/2-oxoacid:ferredoxin oxidoreductase delta subunit|nr:NAD(P)-binding domain-containing protein [Ignavibacteriaceae bacterium]
MEELIENIVIYGFIFGIVFLVMFIYLKKTNKRSKKTEEKIIKAKEFGFHEPVSLHPVISAENCIGSGACIEACPEKDILGWVSGKSKTINTSRCVGHGACFHACPVLAITLCIGTEKRGVELPHISQQFETNIPMLFIAGELGGMGLIKNAVEQGKQAVENLTKKLVKSSQADYDVVIIGAGPAGIAATLTAKKNSLRFLTVEQETLGGTVYHFPRSKIVMTVPLELPLYGKVKLFETSKDELISLWNDVLTKNNITINQQEKVETVEKREDFFEVKTTKGIYKSNGIILAIGRRGSPRKLNVPGEEKEKVYYRLLEPEHIKEQRILVVGGGDSAIESAILLADEGNEVTLSYRSDSFSRVKPRNLERIQQYGASQKISVLFKSNVIEITDKEVHLSVEGYEELQILRNDLVYVFAGGELPTKFLEKIGINITKKFGEAILSHKKN